MRRLYDTWDTASLKSSLAFLPAVEPNSGCSMVYWVLMEHTGQQVFEKCIELEIGTGRAFLHSST